MPRNFLSFVNAVSATCSALSAIHVASYLFNPFCCRQHRLKYVRRQMTYDRHNQTIAGEVVGIVVILRQLVIV